jgi:hypothetical protein
MRTEVLDAKLEEGDFPNHRQGKPWSHHGG